jgi:hypothetical protein
VLVTISSEESGKEKFTFIDDELDITLLQIQLQVPYLLSSFQERYCFDDSAGQELLDKRIELNRHSVDSEVCPMIILYFAPPGPKNGE